MYTMVIIYCNSVILVAVKEFIINGRIYFLKDDFEGIFFLINNRLLC